MRRPPRHLDRMGLTKKTSTDMEKAPLRSMIYEGEALSLVFDIKKRLRNLPYLYCARGSDVAMDYPRHLWRPTSVSQLNGGRKYSPEALVPYIINSNRFLLCSKVVIVPNSFYIFSCFDRVLHLMSWCAMLSLNCSLLYLVLHCTIG